MVQALRAKLERPLVEVNLTIDTHVMRLARKLARQRHTSGLFDKFFNIVIFELERAYTHRPTAWEGSGMRRRPPHLIEVSRGDQRHLEELLGDGRTEQRVAKRARILLAMTDPETVVEQLAEQAALTRFAIWHVCRRYEEIGLSAVWDAPRSGRPWEISPLATSGD